MVEGGRSGVVSQAASLLALSTPWPPRSYRLKPIAVVTIEDVRSLALSLPQTTEALVRGRVKFRVGRNYQGLVTCLR